MNELKPKQQYTAAKISVRKRSRVLYWLFMSVAIYAIGKIIYLQYSDEGYELRAKANSSRNQEYRTIKAQRGAIMSYDGKVLSTTIPNFHLFMDFKSTGFDKDSLNSRLTALSKGLADFYKDKSASTYQNNLFKWKRDGDRYRRVSPRRVDYLELEKLLRLPLLREGRFKGGWVLDTLQYRARPYGDLASRSIGRMSIDGPKTGVELANDSLLRGVNGRSLYQKVSGTFWMPLEGEKNKTPVDGIDVVTTINIEVQDVAESTLREQLIKHNAAWGCAILMDVKSGEVRAIANLGRKHDGTYSDIYNYAIAKNMEPGSTFKLVNLLALLEDRNLSINKIVDCGNGVAIVSRARVVDTRPRGIISLRRVFELSSNIGFAKTMYEQYGDNPQQYIDFIGSKGFSKPFDFGIPGTADPIIYKPGDKYWSGVTLPMMSYGYGLMMTPLHTLAIYNAVANDGVFVKPRIIHGYSKNSNIYKYNKIDTIHPMIASKNVIKELQYTLEQVVNDGTAKVLLNKNYKVAGKSGTAQISKGNLGYHYDGGRSYLASMVGYFPADKPQYSCIVAVEVFHKDGTSGQYYGGQLSGPVFRAIADKVYSQAVEWGNDIERPTTVNLNKKAAKISPEDKVLNVKGGDSKCIQTVAQKLRLPAHLTRVQGEFIAIDSMLRVGVAVRDLDAMIDADTVITPHLTGLGLRDAAYITSKMGLSISVKGAGQISSQIPKAGEKIAKSDTLTLILK